MQQIKKNPQWWSNLKESSKNIKLKKKLKNWQVPIYSVTLINLYNVRLVSGDILSYKVLRKIMSMPFFLEFYNLSAI